ncbi:hypothetical protein ONT16_07550 [Prevotella copri]|uniref:Uncharacterized protein n=1 Tax=Segatella copri TaxID=165179 RepID=A0AAP3F9X8_9BACT|nr:hypothetical protein [Segatella copri]MCW4128109.1 hypothetical protein [Segatella copri]MCW4415616.1 hypothetical protein [Segatella copri]MCW4421521.1 hypothetical protein [Segatella copri]
MAIKQQVMALNPARKGNMGRLNSSQPLYVYDTLIAQPWLKGVIAQIRGEKAIPGVDAGDEKAVKKAREGLKRQLPIRAIHYSKFRNNHRSSEDAVPESFLFQTTIDVDDVEYVDAALEKARELNCSNTIWKGKLLHLEYSARKKLHIDIRMPMGMTIEETQKAYCEAAGIPYDKSCITPERIIFITDKDSEIYRSKEWYGVLPDEEIKARREAFLKRGLTIDGKGIPSGAAIQPAQPGNSHRADDDYISHTGGSQKADGLAAQEAESASEKNLIAFDLFQDSAGLKGMNIDTIGSRHSSLLAIMSAGASRVMSEEELMKVVAKRMPSYYQENDCHQLIHDFYSKYGDSSKPFSRDVIRVNALAEQAAKSLLAGDCKSPERLAGSMLNVQSNACVQSSTASYPPPPPMPGKLPKLVKLLISKTPEIYQPAVAHAIFPPLATHLWNTRFRYIDNVEHEATLMTCLLAGTGAGKSCVQMPISMIMEDIRKRDQENLKREKEWKEEMMRKGANKDKRKRPDNLIIQEIDADMTNPAFVMRTAEAKGHFLYTSLNEIDQFDALKGIGNQHFRIMCLAFDPGNQYGQTRVGTQSVTERVTVRFNWNASTTIQKGQRYFSKVLTDGPLSRINFCTIPQREIGDKIPVYGTYDDQFRKELKPYIENLCMATGLIDCPEAYRLAEILSEENADFSQVTQNRIYENFTFRANVIAYLKACVLYVANGCRWEPEIEDFIRWSERYDLWCKMRFFEEDIQKANNVGEHSNKRGPSNLLQSLPDTFTEQQVVEARAALGLSEEGTAHLLSTWVYRKYVKRGSENYHSNSYHSFTKLKYRCDGQELSQ